MERHFIFTSGRSGSNYLSNTLNESPNCLNYGEILGEWTLPYRLFGKRVIRAYGANRYIDLVYRSGTFYYLAQLYSAYSHLRSGRAINFKRRSNVKSLGLKDFLVTLERRCGLGYLRENKDIKIIYLNRNNLLKRYVSSLHMARNRIASSYTKLSLEPIIVDVQDMIVALNVLEDEVKREEIFVKSLSTHDVLNIEYEVYFASTESIARHNSEIFDFLGVAPAVRQSGQKKILSDRLCDVVSNHSEVVESLESTPYERYIY